MSKQKGINVDKLKQLEEQFGIKTKKVPKYMEALKVANKVVNVREVEIELPILRAKVKMMPMEGIDDMHLKTMFASGANFLYTFNDILFKHLNQLGQELFTDLKDFHAKASTPDKRMMVFGIIAATYDRLPERTIVCPKCQKEELHTLDPQLLLKPDSIMKPYEISKTITEAFPNGVPYTDFGINTIIVPFDDEEEESTQISIKFGLPMEQDKLDVMSITDISPHKVEENGGEILTSLEYLITFIKTITFTSSKFDKARKQIAELNKEGDIDGDSIHDVSDSDIPIPLVDTVCDSVLELEKVMSDNPQIVLDDMKEDIYPFVSQSNLIIQDRITKLNPVGKLEKFEPNFYFNMKCRNPKCNHPYFYNVGNIENEFFRKTLSLYR